MIPKILIGQDNGTSGTLGIMELSTENIMTKCYFMETPAKKEQNYTKKAKNISRLDYAVYLDLLTNYKKAADRIFVVFERPFTGTFTNTAIAAGRCFEAQLVALEQLQIGYEVVDSGEWQQDMLPKGIKGSANLKKASMDVGCRLFPEHEKLIRKHKDADGLLIAEWARRKGY